MRKVALLDLAAGTLLLVAGAGGCSSSKGGTRDQNYGTDAGADYMFPDGGGRDRAPMTVFDAPPGGGADAGDGAAEAEPDGSPDDAGAEAGG
jgi:hypothetical protein